TRPTLVIPNSNVVVPPALLEKDFHYCQRTTASGDCHLRPAGAERSCFGNGISGWAGRLYVSMGERPIEFTTASLGKWTVSENKGLVIGSAADKARKSRQYLPSCGRNYLT